MGQMCTTRTSFQVAAVLLFVCGPALAQESGQTQASIRIAEACGIEMKLSVAGCRCLADRAAVNLTDLQREYLLATAIAPGAAARMRDEISQDDIHTLAKFLASAEEECSAR
jgi:hypothetical protein